MKLRVPRTDQPVTVVTFVKYGDNGQVAESESCSFDQTQSREMEVRDDWDLIVADFNDNSGKSVQRAVLKIAEPEPLKEEPPVAQSMPVAKPDVQSEPKKPNAAPAAGKSEAVDRKHPQK